MIDLNGLAQIGGGRVADGCLTAVAAALETEAVTLAAEASKIAALNLGDYFVILLLREFAGSQLFIQLGLDVFSHFGLLLLGKLGLFAIEAVTLAAEASEIAALYLSDYLVILLLRELAGSQLFI